MYSLFAKLCWMFPLIVFFVDRAASDFVSVNYIHSDYPGAVSTIYIFKIGKLQSCRVGGSPLTAVWQGDPTAVTAASAFNFNFATLVGESDCSHCSFTLQLQLCNLRRGVLTAVQFHPSLNWISVKVLILRGSLCPWDIPCVSRVGHWLLIRYVVCI